MDEQAVMRLLSEVIDPELGVNVVDLGLIYGVVEDGDGVEVRMTLTTPGCPLAPYFQEQVEGVVAEGLGQPVRLTFVFDPPWTPEMMSDEVRATLGFED